MIDKLLDKTVKVKPAFAGNFTETLKSGIDSSVLTEYDEKFIKLDNNSNEVYYIYRSNLKYTLYN